MRCECRCRGANRGVDDLLKDRRADILRIAARHGAHNVRILDPAALGEARPDSDVALLVNFEPGRSLLDLGGLLMDVDDLSRCKVAVFTEKELQERIRAEMLKEAVRL